jgi:serpin B
MEKPSMTIALEKMVNVMLTVFAFSSFVLAVKAQEERNIAAPGQHDDVEVIKKGINEFALKLYAQLRSEATPNVIVSPYSISIALSMTQTGARGETAGQIGSVLNIPSEWDHERVNSASGELIKEMTMPGGFTDCRLDVANRLWFAQALVLLDDFSKQLTTHYQAEVGRLDFAGQPDLARRQINEWVAGKTENQIRDLCSPGTIGPNTLLFLANAIYFKGAWDLPFDQKHTAPARFAVSPQKGAEVAMMAQKGEFRLGAHKNLHILEMSYAGGAVTMTILLPTRADGLSELEAMLTPENLAEWDASLHRKRLVHVYLPRFRAMSRHSLVEPLKGMGVTLPFSEKADFSAMSSTPGPRLSEIIHQATLVVNEEGTVASAATGVVIPRSLVVPPVFRADHPFLFLIRDRRHGVILFLGRVSDPLAA